MRVPFPHVERPVPVPRPALVISRQAIGLDAALIWTLMITNRDHAPWPGDIVIPAAARLGLVIPSKVRTAKVAATEVATASLIGRLDDRTLALVLAQVGAICA